jgi:hypothetical protein
MTYNLSTEEVEKIRDLVRLLVNAADREANHHFYWKDTYDEKAAVDLAYQIDRFIR